MAHMLLVILPGSNLSQRHRDLNLHVQKAATSQVSFHDIAALPEHAPVDRLFKIDLANKVQDLDYILQNIKDDDMLYVSRALKCKWLLERRDVINPKYLENVLFPEMVMPAISKMKHWLYINLRDPVMCQEFYQYYRDGKFEFAVKFLSHCDNEFIVNEFPKILVKITPHYIKILTEKNPKLVKVYFDTLSTNNELVKRYLKDETHFYNNIKCVLKCEPDIFLDITEKYHSLSPSNKLSAAATDYILRYHKGRFMAKSELYIVYFLDMSTVAQRLSIEECKNAVIKLARADYLSWWFSYHTVEPLVKRVSRDCRAAFKKQVFVEKDVGERVTKWPYALPSSPTVDDTSAEDGHVFQDQKYEPVKCFEKFMFKKMVKKRKFSRFAKDDIMCVSKVRVVSELQKLFNEFRFLGFDGTLNKIKQRLVATSSADRRRDMLLVLVSKSGGRADAVRALLQLVLKLRNEPVHERAAIVRSLVKRANAWRLPQDEWEAMLEYAHGLGLDGTKAEAECREGLHAVVLRQLLASGDCDPAVCAAFLKDFSTFDEYKLQASERPNILTGLQRILITAAADADAEQAVTYLSQLLDVLKKYHVRIESSVVLSAVATLLERDAVAARPLLVRLYEAHIGRRVLFRQYLELRQDDAALLNALRHEPEAIKPEWLVKLLYDGKTEANQTLLKLAVYFNEMGGIVDQVRQTLQAKIAQQPCLKLARPLAILAGNDITSMWREQDEAGGERYKLAAALRANMHRSRPAPNALSLVKDLGWRKVGMKAVAWRAMRCSPSHVTQVVQILLENRVKCTVRLALALAPRTVCPADIFIIAATIRPLAALRALLLYFRSVGDTADLLVWEIVKPLITSINLTRCEGVRHILRNVDWVPTLIKPDYCAILYLVLDKISDRNAEYILRHLIEYLPKVNDELLEKVLVRWLESMMKEEPESYPALVIRYLMLSKNDYEVMTRFKKIGDLFFARLDAYHRKENKIKNNDFSQNVDQVMSSMHYNTAFFDLSYQFCLTTIERVLRWIQDFMPREKYFKHYVKIHATMLFYKAVRQSIKYKPDIFQDNKKKMSEGIGIVGFTFGRYIAKELSVLKTQYFDSIIELYQNAFENYLQEFFMYGSSSAKFIVAVMKGVMSDSIGPVRRLVVHILQAYGLSMETVLYEELKELLTKSEDKETLFFLHADAFN